MFFKSAQACQTLLAQLRPSIDHKALMQFGVPKPGAIHIRLDKQNRAYVALAKTIVHVLGEFHLALLWIQEFGIWPTSEDLNLYYRLRSSFGDNSELASAPGHYFLNYEKADAITFLALAVQFGWGGVLVANGSADVSIVFSHDEELRIVVDNDDHKDKVVSLLMLRKVSYTVEIESP